jgi:putative ABC transport system permease protein
MIRQSLLKKRRVALWAVATLAVCATLVTVFAAVAHDASREMRSSLRRLGANAIAYPKSAASSRVWNDLRVAVAATGGTEARMECRVGSISETPLAVVSADPEALSVMTSYWHIDGRRPSAVGEALAGHRLARMLKLEPGSDVAIQWSASNRRTQLHVTGTFESGDEDEGRLFAVAQPSSATPVATLPAPLATYALLSVPGGEKGIDRLAGTIQTKSPQLMIEPLRQIVHGEEKVLDKVRLLAEIALAAVIALSSLGVSSAVLARVAARRREIALFGALGATRWWVGRFLMSESLVVGALGAVVGFGVGTFLVRAVTMRIFGSPVIPDFISFVATVAVTVGVALLAGGMGAWQAMTSGHADTLKGE